MDYYDFYNEQAEKTKELLKNLSFLHKFIFGLSCVHRNAINYQHFSINENFGTKNYLFGIVDASWNLLNTNNKDKNHKIVKSFLESLKNKKNVPDSEDFSKGIEAIDASSITYLVLNFYIENNAENIINAALNSLEVVEKWIYENYGYINDKDPNFKTKILSYDLIRLEIEEQAAILFQLQNSDLNNPRVLSVIKNKISNIKVSNIGLPYLV